MGDLFVVVGVNPAGPGGGLAGTRGATGCVSLA